MRDAWNAFLGVFAIVPSVLDHIVDAAGPAANAIGGETQLLYFGLAILTTQLWRVTVTLSASQTTLANDHNYWLRSRPAAVRPNVRAELRQY
jgi:hypothetical protein